MVDGEGLGHPHDHDLALDAVGQFEEPRFLDLELSHCRPAHFQKPLALLGGERG